MEGGKLDGRLSTGLQERDNGTHTPACPLLCAVRAVVDPPRLDLLGISFMLLVSRQGKVRLAKWFTTMSSRAKSQSLPLSIMRSAWARWAVDGARAELTRVVDRSLAGKIVKDVTQLVLARRTRMCNFLEYKGEQALSLVMRCAGKSSSSRGRTLACSAPTHAHSLRSQANTAAVAP